LDVVGVVIVGVSVFCFLGLFLFTGRGLRFVAVVGGLVAFGLYHMIGFSKKAVLRCAQCGRTKDGGAQP